MAVVSPFVPSPGGLKSTFSPYTDSPSSPFPRRENFEAPKRSSVSSDTLAPPPSPYPQHIDPSPTDSNGTEGTDIEEEVQDQVDEEDKSDVDDKISRPLSREKLVKIDTSYVHSRSNSDDAPPSVIHVPPGYGEFTATPVDIDEPLRKSINRDSIGTTSPSTPDAALGPDDKRMSCVTSPLNTNIPPDKSFDRPTPRAQTRQEVEEEWKQRSRRTSSLEDIPETLNSAIDSDRLEDGRSYSSQQTMRALPNNETEAVELQTALNECWTLCNTLASLSSNHRQRMFTVPNKGPTPTQAWQTCWRLCQQLYKSYSSPQTATLPTLNLCREFCQALFDVRQRGDEATDSVLRVSFEMNNHLYNTHDRNLPEAFRERTLDFHVTLCHRLMKKRTSLPPDTDSLLRSCWSLAETLFNLRIATRSARVPDDELLANAIQACWDLSDIFREGWSLIRPERSTPRAHQVSFPPSLKSHSSRPGSSLSSNSYHDAPSLPPETPTTIFDDATTDGESDSEVCVPDLLVLGTRGTSHFERWSSNASTLSDYNSEAAEESSQRTSSTTRAVSENAHLLRLRVLIIKAALNVGFIRGTSQSLGTFAKGLGDEAFGREAKQVRTLKKWRRLCCVDETLGKAAAAAVKEGGSSVRVTANECAEAVCWLGGNEEWRWLGELFKVVFGFGIGDVGGRGGVVLGI